MSRSPDSGRLNLTEVFRRAQLELQAQLALSRLIEHPSTAGTACEGHWLDILNDYLPKRYRATPAFILNAQGHRSRQIDIAIYDQLHATPLFPNHTAPHLSIESVRAVFEVKPTISRQWLRDAGEKAQSVRALQTHPQKSNILAGLLASTSIWSPSNFQPNLTRALTALPPTHQITLGCALNHGAFDHEPAPCGAGRQACESAVKPTASKRKSQKANATRIRLLTSQPEDSLMFLLLRLINHLNTQPPTPPADLLKYLNPPTINHH